MPPISKISRYSNAGVFRHFEWPDDLQEFGRFNLIYGWNGSGKTTLSRLFRALETRTRPIGNASLCINGQDTRGEQFPGATIPVRVFNREFVAECVFPTQGRMAPILVVGQQNVEKQKRLEALRSRVADTQAALASDRDAKQKAERAFDLFNISQARSIKDALRASGPNRFNNYDKSHYTLRVETMLLDGNARLVRLSDEARQAAAVQSRSTLKPRIPPLDLRLPDLAVLISGTTGLLIESAASGTIARLKDDPALSIWVRDGLRVHKDRGTPPSVPDAPLGGVAPGRVTRLDLFGQGREGTGPHHRFVRLQPKRCAREEHRFDRRAGQAAGTVGRGVPRPHSGQGVPGARPVRL